MVVKQDKRKKNQGRSGEIQTCEKKKIKKANTVYKSCWHGQDMRQKLLNTLCYTKSYLTHIKNSCQHSNPKQNFRDPY